MSDHTANICKRCLLRELSEADRLNIAKYKDAIKKADRVSENLYETRLAICKDCERALVMAAAVMSNYVRYPKPESVRAKSGKVTSQSSYLSLLN